MQMTFRWYGEGNDSVSLAAVSYTHLTFAVVGLTNIFLVIWGFQLAMNGWVRTTAALSIPYFWMYIEIPIACFILMIYSFHNCYICLRGGKVESAALQDQV